MNFLQICQAVRREAGIAGSGPSAITGENEELTRVIEWVQQAWRELQLDREDWWWMRQSFTFNTVAGDNTYTATDAGITALGSWITDSMRIYKQTDGVAAEGRLPFLPYDEWRNIYAIGSQAQQPPNRVTVKPDLNLALGPTPDDVYVVTGDYYAAATSFTAATDVPILPVQYHDAIVFLALTKYAAYEAAPEVYSYARGQYEFYVERIERNQLTQISLPGPLA